MSSTTYVTLSLAAMAALRVVPRNTEAPDHYWTCASSKAVRVCKDFMDATPPEAANYADVVWPFRKIAGEFTRLVNYTLAEPGCMLLVNFEAWVRGDFKSGGALVAENAQKMEELNKKLDTEIERLKPIVIKIGELAKLADTAAEELALENLTPERVMEAASKIIQMFTPSFIESFKIDCERMEAIQVKLEDLKLELSKLVQEYETKLAKLSELMKRYEELGEKCAEELVLYKQEAEKLLQTLKPQSTIHVPCSSITV